MTMPGGQMLPHMSARMRTETIDALFVGVGGYERARAWIEASDANFGEFFTKVWAKGAARHSNVEHNIGDGVEGLLAKLDEAERANNAQVINGDAVEVC